MNSLYPQSFENTGADLRISKTFDFTEPPIIAISEYKGLGTTKDVYNPEGIQTSYNPPDLRKSLDNMVSNIEPYKPTQLTPFSFNA